MTTSTPTSASTPTSSTPPRASVSPGLDGIRDLTELQLKDKRVFVRVDFNVPMNGGDIADDTRIRAALPSLRYVMDKGARVVLASHFGRPGDSKEDRKKFSLEPVGRRLGDLLGVEVILIEDPASDGPKGLLPGLRPNQVILLENLRFDPGETKNGRDLAQRMASYTDVYINDAFGASHRAHASIAALPSLVEEKGIGFLIKKEVEFLDTLLHEPAKPYFTILGGAKVSDKIPVIENMMNLVDGFVIGGAMSYTFLEAQGTSVGRSLVERDKVHFAREMKARLESRGKKILLPIDHVITDSFENPKEIKITDSAVIPSGYFGVDIGPQSRKVFAGELKKAKTVFWNGPMGVFENPEFSKGTFAIAETLAGLTEATTIVGGGDSAAAAEKSGFADRMTHISTGGGASLEYLQGENLPGLDSLRRRGRPS